MDKSLCIHLAKLPPRAGSRRLADPPILWSIPEEWPLELVATKSNRCQMHVRVGFTMTNFTLETCCTERFTGYTITGCTGTESGDILRDHIWVTLELPIGLAGGKGVRIVGKIFQ
jgi:hypothetical protein